MTEISSDDIEKYLAQQLKTVRLEKRLTLANVASQAGISVSHLSRLEAGTRQPSIGTVIVLARILGVELSELLSKTFPNDDHDDTVIRKGSRPVRSTPDGGYMQVSSPLPHMNVDVVQVFLRPDNPQSSPKRHPGEEWIYVLKGVIELELPEKTHQLHVGDAAHYMGDVPHRLRAVNDPAEVLIGIYAGSFPH